MWYEVRIDKESNDRKAVEDDGWNYLDEQRELAQLDLLS